MAWTRARRLTSALSAASMVGLLIALAPPVAAAPAPVVPLPSAGVTADPLPTVQVDGVVWSQVVVGNIVYAGGSFATARPAGAAPGASLVRRTNLLAYDITTGRLLTSFAPTIDGQVLSVAAAPDGRRIYLAGDFTTVNGQVRRRVAALDPVTGALIGAFKAVGVGGQVRSVVATATTVYVGGGFRTLGNGLARNNLAAFRASDGAVLPWRPSADYTVWAVAVSTDGRWLFAGGSFKNVGGLAAYGLAKIDALTGALDTTWKPVVRNAGPDTGISSLRVLGAYVYGTAWTFGSGGNLEGAFKLAVTDAKAQWVTACHGDNYSIFMVNAMAYTVGHAHYCGTMGGGFPQYPQWRNQHAQAWMDAPGGEILTDQLKRANWHGVAAAPSLVAWLPTLGVGTYTGQNQAGWNVTGNSDYIAYGGEFPTVNGSAQQALVRFARRALAPRKRGPLFPAGPFTPRLVPTSPSTLRVSWTAGYDRDDYTLTYRVVRDGNVGTPRHITRASASWWSLPAVGFVDTDLVPGRTYRYQVVATDPDGNIVNSAISSVTMPAALTPTRAYAQSVRTNGATTYWPLDEPSGPVALDRAAGTTGSTNVGTDDATGGAAVAWGRPGAMSGSMAVTLADNDASRIHATSSQTAPNTFAIQAWVRTTTTRGGRILGFGDLQEGYSAHRDRQLWMDDTGHVLFGVRAQTGSARTVASTAPYNDNRWHMLAATMSTAGMRLYVDGALVGQRADTTQGEAYLGYWRVGGDVLTGWAPLPAARNFTGSIDEVAIYPRALTQVQVQGQYALRSGGLAN